MKRWRIQGGGALRAELTLPEDGAIGCYALLLAALAESPSLLRMRTPRAEHRALVGALRAFGVPIAEVAEGFRVAGVGMAGLKAPSGALHAGGSARVLTLVTSLLASQRFGTRVLADASLDEQSVRHWLLPLRARGLHLSSKEREGELYPPLAVAPLLADERPHPVEIVIPTGDPDTKAALLVSGLFAAGITAIEEGMLSHDHLERALVALGLPVQTMGGMTLLDTSERAPSYPGFDWQVPGDFGLGAQLVALASASTQADVVLRGVGTNRSRSAFFDALRSTGAAISVVPKGDTDGNEPVSDLRVRSAKLSSFTVASELAMRALDDVAAFVAIVPAVRGRVRVRDVARLRERPGRFLARAAELLRAFGVDATALDDGFDAELRGALQPARIPADLPNELKLAGCMLAANAPGVSTLEDPDTLDALYPGVGAALAQLGVTVTEEDAP